MEVPILLVGVLVDGAQSRKSVSRADASTIAQDIKALRYIEVTSQEDVEEVLQEIASVILRERLYKAPPKIIELIEKAPKDKKVVELSLRKKQLVCLPNEFFRCSQVLQRLRLDNNGFKYFPEEVLCCPNLSELSLNGNLIEELPSSIVRSTSIVRLEIESNRLETVPFGAVG